MLRQAAALDDLRQGGERLAGPLLDVGQLRLQALCPCLFHYTAAPGPVRRAANLSAAALVQAAAYHPQCGLNRNPARSATSNSSSCSACSGSATAPTAPPSGRKSTPDRAATSRSTPSTRRSIGSKARDCCAPGIGEPTAQRGGRRRKFYALRPAGVTALRQAYHAFTLDGRRPRRAPGARSEPEPPRLARCACSRGACRRSGATSSSATSRRNSERAPRASPPAARRWFWWQTLRCLVRAAPTVRLATCRPPPQGDPFMRTAACRRPPRAPRVPCARRRSRSPSSPSSRSASAPTPPSSASSTPCCCGRCRSTSPIGSSGCSTCRRRPRFPGMTTFSLSPANFYRLAARQHVVRGDGDLPLPRVHAHGQAARAEALRAAVVGPDFFEIVRTPPALGRTFLPEEDVPARARVVVLSDGFWKTPSRRGARRRRPDADASTARPTRSSA